MKWIKDMKENGKPWQDFISGLKLNTKAVDSDTVMVTDCFSIYLQIMASDKTNSILAEESYSQNNITILNEKATPRLKRTNHTLRSLDPLKQVV